MAIKSKTSKKEETEVKVSSISPEEVSETLKALTIELLQLMGVNQEAQVVYDQENDAYSVTIDAGDATGLLIGRKGETLTSIQTILAVLLKQKTGEWKRVVVNIGDYREKEEDYLHNLATSAATRAKETGEPQSLYNLTPAQRRIVHMALAEDNDLVTESMGEGNERYLVIRNKK